MTRIRTSRRARRARRRSLVDVALSNASKAALPKLDGDRRPWLHDRHEALSKKLVTLKAGRYTITVADKSSIHNFHLKGPGLNKEITTVGFVGTKTVILTLKKGKYTFVCDPHFTSMHGSFTVT